MFQRMKKDCHAPGEGVYPELSEKELDELPGLLITHDGKIKYKKNGKFKKISSQNNKRFITYKGRKHYVHRLIAMAFLPCEKDKTLVVHKDGDLSNNHVDNLFWATQSEAQCHNHRIGRLKPTYTKLTKEHVDFIRKQLKKGIPGSILAKQFNVSQMQISRIKHGENWQ